jgi:hypothetical protein
MRQNTAATTIRLLDLDELLKCVREKEMRRKTEK